MKSRIASIITISRIFHGSASQPNRAMVVFALFLIGMLSPIGVRAQVQVGAAADVNNKRVVTVRLKNAQVPKANGSAVAGAKIFHPDRGNPSSSYQVNGAAPTNKEMPILEQLAKEARVIVVNAGNPVAQKMSIKTTEKQIAGCTQPDAVGANPACNVMAGSGTFPLVNKAAGIKSETDTLQRADGAELASAIASQKTLGNGNLGVTDGPVTQVQPNKALANPVAIAYTSNHDPLAVEWGSYFDHSFTVDLSQVQFVLSSEGAGSSASAYFAVHGGVINGTDDIDLPEGQAMSIFDLVLPVNSVDGGSPAVNLDAFQLSALGQITDNLGDEGLMQVAQGLLDDLVVVDGALQFARPYALTVEVPGDELQSVFFLDTQSFAGTAAAAQ